LMFGIGKRKISEELPVYMDEVEFSQLLAIVESVGPRVLVEWGSGGSTRALLERVPSIERYLSIEHHGGWVENVASHVDDPRLELHHVGPDIDMPADGAPREEIIAWDKRCEDEASAMATYVGFPRTLDVIPDLVLVDGRARVHCIREGFELLRPGGVLVLHDAQREAYHGALKACGHAVFLEPFKGGQVALVRKPTP
jgi:SAM-dependent methyltransferase